MCPACIKGSVNISCYFSSILEPEGRDTKPSDRGSSLVFTQRIIIRHLLGAKRCSILEKYKVNIHISAPRELPNR